MKSVKNSFYHLNKLTYLTGYALFILAFSGFSGSAFAGSEDIREVKINLNINPEYIRKLLSQNISKLKVRALVTIGLTWEGVGPGRCIKGGDDQGKHVIEKILLLNQGEHTANFDFRLKDYLNETQNPKPVDHFEYRESSLSLYEVKEGSNEGPQSGSNERSIDRGYQYGYNGILTEIYPSRQPRPKTTLLSRMVSLSSLDGSYTSFRGPSQFVFDVEVSESTMETHDDYGSLIPALVYQYYFNDRMLISTH